MRRTSTQPSPSALSLARRIPPIQCLLTFEALARLRSVTLSADELCVTPSAVSHRVKQLEQILGTQLFGRTDFSLTFARAILIPRLRQFTEAYPEIDLSLQVSIPLLDVVAEDADLMVRFGAGHYADVEHVKIASDVVTPLASPAFVREHGPFVRPEDRQRHPGAPVRPGRAQPACTLFVLAHRRHGPLGMRGLCRMAAPDHGVMPAAGHVIHSSRSTSYRPCSHFHALLQETSTPRRAA